MPPTPRNFLDLLDQQIDRALGCIPETRRGQTGRRWVTPSLAARFETEQAYQDFLDDIEETVDDFLLSARSAGGSTAFDRAAKGFRGPVQEARALAALRDARFHLFRIDAAVRDGILSCANIQTGEPFRLFWPLATTPDLGLVFFCRLAEDNTGLFFPAGAITPMDDAALEVATGPACPARFSRDKESRWVEAVYMHVVRNGTAAVPGLTAPQDAEPAEGMLTDMDHRLLPILLAWGDLGDAEADQDLIEAT
jgi:hypothetical protein